MTSQAVAVVLALVLAPISLVVIVALVRGYDIHLTIRRRKPPR
jgi:hypothetical protein